MGRPHGSSAGTADLRVRSGSSTRTRFIPHRPNQSAVQLEAGPAEDGHRNRDSCEETRVETAVVGAPDSSSAPPAIPCSEILRAPALSASPNANPPPPRFPLRCLVCARGNAPVKASFYHYWIAITAPHPPPSPPPCHAAANDRPCFLERPWRRHHPPTPIRWF